jgi:hypothetical protein
VSRRAGFVAANFEFPPLDKGRVRERSNFFIGVIGD